MIPRKPTEKQPTGEIVPARAWLEHFPANKRSGVANLFHFAVRAGACAPAEVQRHVSREVRRRLSWANDPESTTHLLTVLEGLQTDPAGTLAYSRSVIDYEALPLDTRRRVKAERAFAYLKEAMKAKPVTEPQLAYLRALGYQGDPLADRAAASALIDELRRGMGMS